MMMCSRCKKRPAVVFISSMQGTERRNEGLCLRCAKEMGLPQVDEYLKQMGISEEDFENAYDSMFDENGNPDPELLKNIGFEDITNGFKPHDSDTDDDDSEDDVDDSDDPDKKDELFQKGGANTMPEFFKKMFEPFEGALSKDDMDKLNEEAKAKSPKKKQEKTDKKRRTLETFCTNLTRRAKDGKIDRIIGRDKEIGRVIQILSRRTKNNPCLIGEPGVGKTAIAEGIALKLASGDVPFRLQGKELYLLDLTALVAGTQFRGQFESRVKSLIDEVKNAGNVILFIDEVHNLVGTGDSEGTMNAGNMFKPALSRGELQVIGATTFNEYRKYIEKDSALERRFQPVTVNEPSIGDTVKLLEGIKEYYEEHHKVKVSPEITRMCAVLSERYINDRFLPDKAIDLLDESCACASLGSPAITEYEKLKSKLAELRVDESKLAEASDKDYEKMAEIKMQIAQTSDSIDKIKKEAENVQVTMEDLSKVIELWTGIPANKIQEAEYKRIGTLEQHLKEHVIGQDEACELVAKAIKRTRVQLTERRRPASFIFVGPTGVGKTELVKVLASEMFDTVEPLIRLDMSEFMEKHSVSKLIGSPPGYVGFEEEGQLIKRVRSAPYSVVLFDEVEKAHPDVLNLLLQILEEGTLTAADGKRADFRSSIVIMTGNIGAEQLSKNTLGFGSGQQDDGESEVLSELKKRFSPELINRIDNVVVFRKLGEEQMESICRILLRKLTARAQLCGIELSFTNDAVKHICRDSSSGRERGMGARPLRRTITAEIENMLSGMMISGGLRSGSRAEVCEQSGLLSVRVLSTQ